MCRENRKAERDESGRTGSLRLFDRLKARKIIEATGKAQGHGRNWSSRSDRNFWRGRIENGEKRNSCGKLRTSHLIRWQNNTGNGRADCEAFPGYTVYRAFTSQTILNKLERTEHKKYDNVRQALERRKQDGDRKGDRSADTYYHGIEK